MSVTALDVMPPCVGHHSAHFQCAETPANFVIGVDLVDNITRRGDEGLALVYGAACSAHVDDLRAWLSTPIGAWTAPYEAQVLRDLRSALDGEYQASMQLVPEATSATA